MPAPHPLAAELVKRLPPNARNLLELGRGNGRNLPILIETGAEVWAVDGFEQLPATVPPFDGVLSTHALLHGTLATIRAALARIAGATRADAPFCATFGSVRDARFGKDKRLGDATFASTEGDEAGVAHSYFDERDLRRLLHDFSIERLDEVRVDDIAGKWAHATTPLQGTVHWFFVGKKKS